MSFNPVISPEELLAQDTSGVRFVDARGGAAGAAAYAAAHLPGAVHVDLDRDLSGDKSHPEKGGRHPLPDIHAWRAQLGTWGIGPDTPVVVYDDKNGVNAAARFWWMLRAVGHRNVAVLDGGIQAAVAAGMETTAAVLHIADVGAYPVTAWQGATATIDDVAQRAADSAWTVLDVREGPRFRGESEAVDPVAGHIPGAVNLFYGENLEANGRFRSPEVLRSQYEQLLRGADASALVVQCGSGVTACHTLVALERAGLPGASLYVGSWSEWCRSGRPLARGPA